MRDIGGQINFRKDWRAAFEGVNGVVFILALDAYAYEDGKGRNELRNSLQLARKLATEEGSKCVLSRMLAMESGIILLVLTPKQVSMVLLLARAFCIVL